VGEFADVMVVIRGIIRFPHAVTLPREATLCVRLIDATQSDANATTLANATYKAKEFLWPADSIAFVLEARLDDPRRDYLVVAHVNQDGVGPPAPGDFITTQSYPLTEDFRLTGPIVVHGIGP
jgi:uncharacterized lipoprotein YbaY